MTDPEPSGAYILPDRPSGSVAQLLHRVSAVHLVGALLMGLVALGGWVIQDKVDTVQAAIGQQAIKMDGWVDQMEERQRTLELRLATVETQYEVAVAEYQRVRREYASVAKSEAQTAGALLDTMQALLDELQARPAHQAQ